MIPTAVVAFAESAVGRVIIGVAFLFLWTAYQRADAAKDAKVACKEAQLAATVKEVKRQLDVNNEVIEKADARANERAEKMRSIDKLNGELREQIKDLKDSCGVPEPALRKLRDIR